MKMREFLSVRKYSIPNTLLMRSTLVLILALFIAGDALCDALPRNHRKVVVSKQVKKKKSKKKAVVRPSDTVILPQSERHYPPPGSGGEERNYDWYFKRAFPNTEIDPTIYEKAIEDARKLPVYHPRGKQIAAATMEWKSLGPVGIGGRVTSIAMHPTDSNIFYVGAAAGGLWKTTDRGASWRSLTDTFATLPVGVVSLDPHDPNTIYLGLGEVNGSADCYPGNGLWRSTDGGDSWVHLGLEKTRYIATVIVDPTDRNTIYVASPGISTLADSNRGVFRSKDFGLTWKQVLLVRDGPTRTSTPIPIIDLVMNPFDGKDLVAASWDKEYAGQLKLRPNKCFTGLWRTTDGGDSWRRIDTAKSTYPDANRDNRFGRTSLIWAPTPGKATLYSVVTKTDTNIVTHYPTDDNLYGIFKTTDPEADTWVKCLDSSFRIPYKGNNVDSVDLFYRQGTYNNYMGFNPKRPDEIYVGGIDVIRSTDAGMSWSNITTSYPHYFTNDRTQHSDQHCMAVMPTASGNDLYVGSDGGVFHTANFGESWTQLKGLPITMFYHLEPWAAGMAQLGDNVPVDSIKLIGGTQDNGSLTRGLTGDADWLWVNRGDGGFAQAHPNDKEKLVTSIQLGKVLVRNTFSGLRPNLQTDEGSNNPDRWYQISKLLTHGPTAITDTSEPVAFIPYVVLDQQKPEELYTGRTFLYKAKIDWQNPDNTTWQRWSPQIAGQPNTKTWYYGAIDAVALGVRDASGRPMVWAGGIFNGATSLWRSTVDPNRHPDSMTAWTKITTGLPGSNISCIVPDREDSLTAFCSASTTGNVNHVFKTTNGGKNWISISGDMPKIPVTRILINTFAEQGDPKKKNQCIIASTDIGVFATTNGGKNWLKLGTGLPISVVEHVTMYKNWLVAGTHARGAWALDVKDLVADEIASGVADNGKKTSFSLEVLRPNPLYLASSRAFTAEISGNEVLGHIKYSLIETATGRTVASGAEYLSGLSGTLRIELSNTISSGMYSLEIFNDRGEHSVRALNVVR
jgi:photosystem II stability/assembly factor-like uncharacterized protein